MEIYYVICYVVCFTKLLWNQKNSETTYLDIKQCTFM